VVTLVPSGGGPTLRVPYQLVARARSDIGAALSGKTLALHNDSPRVAGAASAYVWGLVDDRAGLPDLALKAVGTRSFHRPDGRMVSFALNTHRSWSNPAALELRIDLDTDGVPGDDVRVVASDGGAYGFGPSYVFRCAVIDLHTGATSSCQASTSTTQATAILTVAASDLGVSPSSPRATYRATSYARPEPYCGPGCGTAMPGVATVDAYATPLADAPVTVAPGASAEVKLKLGPAFEAVAPLGVMVVVPDNLSHEQALLLRVAPKTRH
jgi:hypothetical protein